MESRPSPILRLLMGWLTLSFILAWLPLVRSFMDGITYEWGTSYFGVQFSGAGLTGDLWLLVALSVLAMWLLYRGWRNPTPPFAAVLLAWLGLAAADSLYTLLLGGGFHFEGATLGVSVSLSLVAPLLHVGFFVLAVIWSVRHRRKPHPEHLPTWTGTNLVLVGLVVALFPVQYILLSAGQGQEAKDVIGVLLTIGQWILISMAFFPWKPRRSMPGEIRLAKTISA
jgi:hypothetical protein